NIYNVDETGLFYRVLPRQTYLAPSENHKTARGVKSMKAKELFTTYICVSASGTAKLTLVFKGTTANPRCFSEGKILLPKNIIYLNQTRAWSDTRTFGLWFRSLLRYIRKIKWKPVLFLIDNHSGHASLEDPNNQVKVMEFSPNYTSRHQPADAGTIQVWKTLYKSALLSERVDMMAEAPRLRQQAKALEIKAGTMGLVQDHQPHVLDAIELGRVAWDKITQETITR
ncbi:unnamed protein product, partial [Ascophyllum nodosum]